MKTFERWSDDVLLSKWSCESCGISLFKDDSIWWLSNGLCEKCIASLPTEKLEEAARRHKAADDAEAAAERDAILAARVAATNIRKQARKERYRQRQIEEAKRQVAELERTNV